MAQPPLVFGGRLEEGSPYAVLGVPLEHGPTFREGTRWAPLEVRKASNYIEFRCELSGSDADLLGFYDLGDVPVVNDVKESLKLVEAEVSSTKKVPLIIGGEHTLTYAALKALRPDCLVVFDAHLDARDEYAGDPWSHASWLRRALEELELSRVAVAGARAYVEEEARFLGKRGVLFGKDLRGFLKRYLRGCKSIYVSLDMDYFDPSVVPGVSNPEPGGATFSDFLEHVKELQHLPLAGADVVELSPPYDPSGVSAVYAARALIELATSLRPLSRSPLSPSR
ncbi:arginase family protein [Ignicoccus hospitalis]|uniref:Agmatinase n=1 Tax=Ignicoccus hospitalis (strain KIN4/I / DSM 18386 / JCM 14125) TaxID=453591 RepID=A8AC95_IGNH4|nr:arginase family protein [Ignicoccus hospitalis]ABU82547.1 agmatinase [Ignicoccus hospitalis KIN4/I]HIH90712.1 hypothetical protein [Desulfurococcaceae archaeon]